MKKASLLAVLLAFVAVFFTAIAILPERARATTLYVGGAGPGNYTTIQDAIDAASPGDTVYVYSGTYFENVIINKTITLKGEDRDTTMVEGNGTADTFQVSTDFVNISGFTIGGSGPSWEGSAIGLNSSQGCHIADNNVSNNGHGINLLLSNNTRIVRNIALNTSFGISLAYSENNEVAENQVSETHVHGIELAGSEDNLILANNVSDNNWVGILVIGSGMNRIESNTISRNLIDGVFLADSSFNRLENDTISSNGRMGIAFQNSRNTTLNNNLMVENGVFIQGRSKDHWNTHTIGISNTVNGRPIRYWRNVEGGTVPSEAGQVILGNCSGVIVENQDLRNASVAIMLGYSNDNSIANNIVAGNYFGLYLEQSVGNTISDNDLIDNWDQAVWLYSSDDNRLLDNDVSDNGHGIHLEYSDGCEIAGNVLLSNLLGVHLRFSNSSTIANNRISDNYGGLHLERTNLSKVLRNHFTGNYYGIDMDFSDSNIVSENTVSSNTQGINLFSSDKNSIYSNNFLNNSRQAADINGTNWWDNGYPAGGNYWSDYEGVDRKRGPGQDMDGSDGIGDAPREIEGGTNKDQYPLMNPFSEEVSIFEQPWFWVTIGIVVLFIVVALVLEWRRRKKIPQEGPPV